MSNDFVICFWNLFQWAMNIVDTIGVELFVFAIFTIIMLLIILWWRRRLLAMRYDVWQMSSRFPRK